MNNFYIYSLIILITYVMLFFISCEVKGKDKDQKSVKEINFNDKDQDNDSSSIRDGDYNHVNKIIKRGFLNEEEVSTFLSILFDYYINSLGENNKNEVKSIVEKIKKHSKLKEILRDIQKTINECIEKPDLALLSGMGVGDISSELNGSEGIEAKTLTEVQKEGLKESCKYHIISYTIEYFKKNNQYDYDSKKFVECITPPAIDTSCS